MIEASPDGIMASKSHPSQNQWLCWCLWRKSASFVYFLPHFGWMPKRLVLLSSLWLSQIACSASALWLAAEKF